MGGNQQPNPSVEAPSPTPMLSKSSPASATPPPSPITAKTAAKPRNLVGQLAIFTYLLSLPVLAAGVWLMYMRDYDCEDLLRMPRLKMVIGVGMLFVFLVSNAVAFYGSRLPLPGLVVVMVPLIVMLTVGLALVGSYKMESRALPDSPMWLRLRVSNQENWKNIKTCIYDSEVCSDLGFRTVQLTSYDFSLKKLSPIESGCCKPPALCGMEYVNATFWKPAPGANGNGDGGGDDETTAADPSSSFGDCHAWSNDNNRLCYNCESCKVGFLRTLQYPWRRLGVFLTVMAVLLAVTHFLRFLATISGRYSS